MKKNIKSPKEGMTATITTHVTPATKSDFALLAAARGVKPAKLQREAITAHVNARLSLMDLVAKRVIPIKGKRKKLELELSHEHAAHLFALVEMARQRYTISKAKAWDVAFAYLMAYDDETRGTQLMRDFLRN